MAITPLLPHVIPHKHAKIGEHKKQKHNANGITNPVVILIVLIYEVSTGE